MKVDRAIYESNKFKDTDRDDFWKHVDTLMNKPARLPTSHAEYKEQTGPEIERIWRELKSSFNDDYEGFQTTDEWIGNFHIDQSTPGKKDSIAECETNCQQQMIEQNEKCKQLHQAIANTLLKEGCPAVLRPYQIRKTTAPADTCNTCNSCNCKQQQMPSQGCPGCQAVHPAIYYHYGY